LSFARRRVVGDVCRSAEFARRQMEAAGVGILRFIENTQLIEK
jgi:hypothetical protein